MHAARKRLSVVLTFLAIILIGATGIFVLSLRKDAGEASKKTAGADTSSNHVSEGDTSSGTTNNGKREERAAALPEEAADSVSETEEFYADVELVDSRDDEPDADGKFTRTRLIRKELEKYPLIRVEEEFSRGKDGEEILLGRVAMVADHVLVALPAGLSDEEVSGFAAKMNMKVRSALGTGSLYLFELPEADMESVPLALIELGKGQEKGFGAEYAEPDFIVHALNTSVRPDDRDFSKLWGLENTGQVGGRTDADIDAPEAWAISTGNEAVVVGVIDTGIDRFHPDLKANIWINPGEIPDNGIDDDNNGYIDDAHGYNFVKNNQHSIDDHYHGTHVAGTIGAVGDNGIGVVGVARKVKMIPLKFLSESGSGATSDAIRAIAYATDNGAALTNNSWGGGAASQSLRNVIEAGIQAGTAFIAAAGNDKLNTDIYPSYPSSYDMDGIISVASSQPNETLSSFSNYGQRTVDLAAPGSDIYSTAPNNTYKYASGTSMACPHVAGAYALLKSVNPGLDIAEIKRRLMTNADMFGAYNSGTVSGGRLNLLSSLNDQPTALLSIKAVALSDKAADGADGNGNGVYNPGENIVVNVSLENVGLETARNVTLRLRPKAFHSPHASVTQPISTSADIPGGGTAVQRSPFRIQIAANAPGATVIPMVVEVEAEGGLTWSGEFVLSIYNSTSIAGVVRDSLGGAGIANARVSASGAASVETLSATDGSYTLDVIDGSYQVKAEATGFANSDAVTVSVPPAATGIDFGLGKSSIEITPAFFDVALNQGQSTQRSLTISNNGNRPLEYTILTQYSLASYINAKRVGAAGTSGLPFYEDFESGDLGKWQADSSRGIREIRTGNAAAGDRSLFIKNENYNLHKRGLHTDLPPKSRPTEIRFSVRPSAADKASGFFVVHDRSSSRELIWFHAGSNGRFSVNPENGGDETHPYEPGRWYDIRFENINWTAKTFDFLVDGFPVKTGVGFRNPSSATEASRIYLYNFDSGAEASWDNIVLSEGLGWLLPAETSGTVAPGASRQIGVGFAAGNLPHADYTAELVFHTNVPGQPVTKVPATLRVAALPNTAPVASSGTVSGTEDNDIPVTLGGSDAEGNTLRARIVSLPENGSLYQVFGNGSTGPRIDSVPAILLDPALRLKFRPAANGFGSPYSSFNFTLEDGKLTSPTATVTVNVSPVNDIPVARDDRAYSRDGSAILSIPVLLNDSDVETAVLSISTFTQGSRGAVADNGNGTLSYTPEENFAEGIDTFTYKVLDDDGATANATVLVRVGYISGGDWETTGNGPGRSGFYDAYLGGNLFELAWENTFEGKLGGSAIVGGKVYTSRDLPQSAAQMVSMDLSSGAVVWSQEIPGQNPASVDPPTWNDGKLYFLRNNHSSDSQLWALNAQDGNILWNSPFQQQWERHKAPLVTDSGIWFNGGSYGGLYGYKKDGTRNFFQTLPQYDNWTPATRDGSEIYSYVAGVFRSNDPLTGVQKWAVDLDKTGNQYGPTSTVAVDGANAFVAGGSALHSVNLDTRKKTWTVAGNFSGEASVANGKVYVISARNSVASFHTASGQPATVYSVPPGSLANQPIITNDTLIVGSTQATYVFNLDTGALLQTLPVAGDIALADGFLVVTPTNNYVSTAKISAYRISTGNNAAPVAQPQTVSLQEDTEITVTLSGTDADGELVYPFISRLPLAGVIYQTADGVTRGKAILSVPALVENQSGKIIYVPEENGFGTAYDSIGFKVSDGRAVSSEARITMDVNGINDAPVAVDDVTATRSGKVITAIRPLLNDWDADNDTLVLAAFTQGARGTVAANGDGTLSYTPNADFTEGEDVFQYTITDALGIEATASITVLTGVRLGGEWPTLGGNNKHTGYVPINSEGGTWTEKWSREIGTLPLNQVAIGEGKIFVTPRIYFTDSSIHALDTASGANLWAKNIGKVFSLNPPTYFGGKVYFQNGKATNSIPPSQLSCLDVREGETSWIAPISAQWERYLAPTVTAKGIWVNGGSYGGLYGFNPSGTQKFFQNMPQKDSWKAATDDDGTLLTWIEGELRANDPDTGELEWSVKIPSESATSAPVIGQRRAYMCGGSALHCIHLDTHVVSWSVSGNFQGLPAIANGAVYAATSGGEVRSYNPTTGRLLTTYTLGEQISYGYGGQPLVTNDLLIVSAQTKTYLFELHTGILKQTLNVAGHLSMAGENLFIAGSNGTLYSYGRSSDNNLPVAIAAQLTVSEDGILPLHLEGEDVDGDPLRAIIRTLPANGKLYQTTDGRTPERLISSVPVVVSNENNNVVFVPDPDGTGAGYGNLSFAFTDGLDVSAPALFTINVTPVNDAPRPVADFWTTAPGQRIAVLDVLYNDLDIDGDTLVLVSFTPSTKGLVERNGETLSYAPNADAGEGTDTFTYTVADPSGLTATATVTIEISSILGKEWRMLGNDAKHSGYVPVNLGAEPWQPGWIREINPGSSLHQVAVGGGGVYVTHPSYFANATVHALDKATGATLWTLPVGDVYSISPPAYGDGSVYVEHGKGSGNSLSAALLALDAEDGTNKWTLPVAAQWQNYRAPTFSADSVWVNGGAYGGMYGANRSSGEQLFFRILAQEDQWTPASDGTLLYSSLKGEFEAHDPVTGESAWKTNLTVPGTSWYSAEQVVLGNGYAFFIKQNENLYCVNLATRELEWNLTGPFTGLPAVANGRVYASRTNGDALSVDVTTGRLLKTYSTGQNLNNTQPLVTNDMLFLGSGNGSARKTWVFDIVSGQVLHSFPYSGELSIADGTLYIAATDGTLYTFGRPNPDNTAPIAIAGNLVIDEDHEASITLQGTDAEDNTLRVIIATLPASGKLFQTDAAGLPTDEITIAPATVRDSAGRVHYIPEPDGFGTGYGSFGFLVSDGFAYSEVAAFGIDVSAVNDAPVARNDYASTAPGQLLSPVHIQYNDTDVDGDEITLVSFTQGTHGKVSLNPAGGIAYMPDKDALSVEDYFTYIIRDTAGETAQATVRISVNSELGKSWPTFGGSPSHSGYLPVNLGTGSWSQGWEKQISGGTIQQVVVADGAAFVVPKIWHSSGFATSLDTETGTELWKHVFPTSASLNPPTVHNGQVYIQRGNHSGDTQLWSLDTASGTPRWSAPFSAQWSTYFAPAVTDNGIWINGGSYGGIYGFTPGGTQKFFANLPQYDKWTPSIGPDGTVYSWVAGVLTAHDPDSGVVLWSVNIGWDWRGWSMNTVSAIGEGYAFVIGSPGLHAVDLTGKKLAWSVEGNFTGSPAVSGGVVCAIRGSEVHEFSVTDGKLLGVYKTAGTVPLINQPLTTNDLLIVSSQTNTFVFERYTAKLLQTLPGGGELSLADGRLYVAGNTGNLRVFIAPWSVRLSPDGGQADAAIEVTLTASDPTAEIYYSLNGTAPQFSRRKTVSGGTVSIEKSSVLLAVSVSATGEVSPVKRAEYIITDSDSDGLADWWERLHFGSLTVAGSTTDSDKDGLLDKTEFTIGSLPESGNSNIITPEIKPSGAGFRIEWQSAPGKSYVVESTCDLKIWTDLSTELTGTGSPMTYTDPTANTDGRCFYRIRIDH